MISAWKKFINKSQDGNQQHEIKASDANVPPGVQKLDKELQRKFARGVNYNMKIIIKGDTQVGKTSLFLRLKGYGFEDNYEPTENLNVTSINWNYKATDDIVKIDLWEAVDSIASKKTTMNYIDLKLENKNNNNDNSPTPESQTTNNSESNKNFGEISPKVTNDNIIITNTKLSLNGSVLNNNHQSPIPEVAKQSLALLSEHLDVYKGAHAVLLVMDMTKNWTFKYIQNELPKIPKDIPILIVANHRDQGHHRTVSPEQVKVYIDGLDRCSPCDGIVMYTEASMKNGFGLKLIERFFNIPFLKLQEASLLKQLELNRCDFMATLEELNIMQESTNKEYEQYLELQTIRRRQEADAMSPVNNGLKQLNETTREQIRNTTISSETVDYKNAKSIESNNKPGSSSVALQLANEKFVNNRLPSIVIGANCPLPDIKTIQINNTNRSNIETTAVNNIAKEPPSTLLKPSLSKDINNSSNESQLKSPQSTSSPTGQAISDDDDDDSEDEDAPKANPLVANYQSDLDSDDQAD